MPEWMRSQFMAPVYALLISLSVAFVLGAAMSRGSTPGQQQPTGTVSAAALTVRLVTAEATEQGRRTLVPAKALAGTRVNIHRAESDATLSVGDDGLVSYTPVNGPLTVCVPQLPEKWTGRGATPGRAPWSPCWDVDPQAGTVDLEVAKEG